MEGISRNTYFYCGKYSLVLDLRPAGIGEEGVLVRFVLFAVTLLSPLGLGVAAVGGYGPFYFYPLPILALAVLFRLWSGASARQAFLSGLAFGFGFFGAGVSWVYVSMHDFGHMQAPLAALATVLFCAFFALFPASVGWLQARCSSPATARRLLAAAILWAAAEWVRGWLFTGFPWLALGYSQAPFSPLAGFAPVLGVYGVSLVAALSSALLAAGFRRTRPFILHPSALILLAALWATGWGLKQVAWTQPTGVPVTVSLLQGDIPQDLKWREDRLEASLATYARLLLASEGKLAVLPETALPLFRHQLPADYEALLEERGRMKGGDVIVGLPEYADDGHEEYYNSAFSFGASAPQVYRKHHLVPFGEYIPFKAVLGWINQILVIPLADFSRGAVDQKPMRVAGQAVAVDICYEDVFGEEIIRQLPEATLLVNISNDAWFGDSVAPWQHLQISQMRALETGRFMLRATNTGMTAIVNQRGEVVRAAEPFTPAVLEGKVQGFGGATPYVRWGNYPALALMALLMAAVQLRRWKR